MGLAGRRVLVTGGTGFIGSHLSKKLLEEKAEVIIPLQDLIPKSYFFENDLDKKCILVNLNVKDFKQTLDVISKYEVDFIFHLAAQTIVTVVFKNPLETLETNVMGTVNVLEAARLYGKVKKIIVTSSDKAYGKIPRAKETDPLSGDHPYEVSKSAADLISYSYFKTYNLPVVVTRFGNVYGEGDLNFSRIVPGIMKSAALDKVFEVRSNGKYVRDYIYVDDVVEATLALLKDPRTSGEAFNISSFENLSVLELIQKVQRTLKQKLEYKIKNEAVNEIPVQSVSFKKIHRLLGWKPKNSLLSTIPQIFQWYNKYFEKA